MYFDWELACFGFLRVTWLPTSTQSRREDSEEWRDGEAQLTLKLAERVAHNENVDIIFD